MLVTLDEALAGAADEREARRLLGGYLFDALVTLPRVWARAITLGAVSTFGAALVRGARHAARTLARRPAYALVIVLTLALALGANTAIFSVTHAVLLRALPYDAPERVVRAEPAPIGAGGSGAPWGVHPDFSSHPAVAEAAVYLPAASANLVEGESASHIDVAQVGDDFFDALGVELTLGGGLRGGAEGGRRAVLSHRLWTRSFGADRSVVGRAVTFSGHPYTVVGVAPPGVHFPAATEAWLSFPVEPDFFGGAFGPDIVARVVPGVDPATLIAVLENRLARQYADAPPSLERPAVAVIPIEDELVGAVRAPLWVLMASAVAVLLLGCLNLMSVVLSRVSDRREEIRVRSALGAGRRRVFGDLLAEVTVLALLGGAVGIGLAHLGTRVLVGWLPPETPGLDTAGLSTPVLLVALAATVLAAVLAGALPALRGAWHAGLPRPGSVAATNASTARVHSWLIVGQVCLACVLAVGAALLGRSLREVTAVPLGYETERLLTFRTSLPAGSHPDPPARRAYLERVLRDLGGLEGVRSVGATSRLPLTTGLWRGTTLRAEEGAEPRSAIWVDVAGSYFETMGVRFVEGRPFDRDDPTEDRSVLVSETLARQLFGEASAVGRTVLIPVSATESAPRTVRGVVSDVRMRGRVVEDRQAIVYASLERSPVGFPAFAVRADVGVPSTDLTARIRGALDRIDPTVPPIDLQPADLPVSRELATQEAGAVLTALFGLSALLLVALGLYGLLGQRVARRRRELGIRIALGATAERVVGGLVARGLGPVAVGAVVGLSLAYALAGRLEIVLYETSPRDPVTYAVVGAAVAVVALLAAWVPARRASRLDPAESLRVE